jgi:hypothetical protein
MESSWLLMATWSVDIYDINGSSALATGLPVQDWMFNYVLNAPGALEADFYIKEVGIDETLLVPGAREIRVMRNGTLVWGGYLWNVVVDVLTHKLRIQCEGYFSRLRRRVITDEFIYDEENVQTIMWELIEHVQSKSNGDHEITQGTHTGGNRTVDAEYCAGEFPIVADSIDSLTQMDDGCDWIITPTIGISSNKVFRTYQPRKGSDVSGSVVLTEDNLFNLQYEWNASELANWVKYIGPGDCNPPDVLVQSSPSQTTYGQLEQVVETDEFDGYRDLNSHAREYLRQYKNPRYIAHAVYYENKGPAWGDFVIGDIVKVNTNWGFADFNRDMRVLGLQAELTVDAVNFFDLTLDTVID